MKQTAELLPPAAMAFSQSPLPALRDLRVSETETEVVISGFVSSYYLKQLALEAVRPFLGDRRLLNKVIVTRTS